MYELHAIRQSYMLICHELTFFQLDLFDPLRKIRGEPTSQCRLNLLMVLSLCNSSCQPEYSMQWSLIIGLCERILWNSFPRTSLIQVHCYDFLLNEIYLVNLNKSFDCHAKEERKQSLQYVIRKVRICRLAFRKHNCFDRENWDDNYEEKIRNLILTIACDVSALFS